MDKVLDILRNKWVKFGVSFLSLGLPIFFFYIDWLAFAYYLEPTNDIPLFLLYVLVNFVFAGIMFYTRRQIITRIVVCITPLLAFVLLIIAFGQWYLIVPPVAICAITFLAAGTNETLKTILGTVYLLMFVVGTLVYLTMLHFNLTVRTFLQISGSAPKITAILPTTSTGSSCISMTRATSEALPHITSKRQKMT